MDMLTKRQQVEALVRANSARCAGTTMTCIPDALQRAARAMVRDGSLGTCRGLGGCTVVYSVSEWEEAYADAV